MKMMRHLFVAVLIVASAFLAGCQSGSNGTAEASGGTRSFFQRSAAVSLTIPDGSDIVVRLVDSIGSSVSRSGQTFDATIAQPIEVNGKVAIPRGAEVTGRVVSARASGHLQTPAELALELTSVKVEGRNYDLYTSERAWRGRSHKGHDAKWIGGMAGGGALLGALIGHGTGAVIGAGVGAGAGTATAYATGKKNIYLPSETELRFIIRRPLIISLAG